MKKKAEFWDKIDGDKVKCKVCSHYCVIPPGKRGICKTRENQDGELYTLIYASLSSRGSVDPIEKKPLYHFWPGSDAYSIATVGCNFNCKHCQNWHISRSFPIKEGKYADFLNNDKNDFNTNSFNLSEVTAEETVQMAIKSDSKSIAYTYNEPTIWFEYVRDCSILAHKNEIKNILVTNGYSSLETNKEYIKFIDGANIDIKSFSDAFYKKIVGVPKLKPVLDTCKFFKENGIHLEITNLIIPGENDSIDEIRKLSKWVAEKLGNDSPIHFSAYRSEYRLSNPRTSQEILEKAYDIAKEEGLFYVYLGNIYSNKGSHTKCHNCGEILINRRGYQISLGNLKKDNLCGKCETKAFIDGKYIKSKRSLFF